jgi:hypothetical protein
MIDREILDMKVPHASIFVTVEYESKKESTMDQVSSIDYFTMTPEKWDNDNFVRILENPFLHDTNTFMIIIDYPFVEDLVQLADKIQDIPNVAKTCTGVGTWPTGFPGYLKIEAELDERREIEELREAQLYKNC